jgi:NAD(P)-dependent dehydrogenase (short-subunit alcohol dehydrogenase family)
MDLGLKGKSVLVTGGSKGIGFACARAFAAEGCKVHIASRNAEKLAQAARELGGAKTHAADLRDAAQLKKLAADCADVDILVNNAGDIPGGTLEALDDAKWRHAWELKVFGFINLTRELYPQLKKRKGVVVNVIGMAAEHPTFEYICGAVANSGLANFTRALGKGYAQHGVRVVGVHPPSTRTDRIINLMKTQAKARFGDESRYEELMGNVIEPEQVGDTVCFLASPRAGQLSGVVLNLGN